MSKYVCGGHVCVCVCVCVCMCVAVGVGMGVWVYFKLMLYCVCCSVCMCYIVVTAPTLILEFHNFAQSTMFCSYYSRVQSNVYHMTCMYCFFILKQASLSLMWQLNS